MAAKQKKHTSHDTNKNTEGVKPDHKPTTLLRSETDRVIAGVAAGVAKVFGVDPVIVRLLFVITTLFGGGGLLVYLVLWFIVPSASKAQDTTDQNIKNASEEIKEKIKETSDKFSNGDDNTKTFIGVSAVIFGFIILAQNFGFARFVELGRLWPILIIILGFLILRNSKRA